MEVNTQSRLWMTNYQVIPSSGRPTPARSCTKCSVCNKCLAGEETVSQGGGTYCWQCFTRIYAFTCVSCSKIITGDKKVSFIGYNNQVWHTDCFRCSNCRRSLQGSAQGVQPTQYGKFLYCWRCSEKQVVLG